MFKYDKIRYKIYAKNIYFFGIVVYMYYDDHNPPHFHASYEGLDAVFDFKGNLIRGYIPVRAQALIKEWCSLHMNELK